MAYHVSHAVWNAASSVDTDGAGAVATAGQARTNSKFAASMTAEKSANIKYATIAYQQGIFQPIL